MIMRNYHDFSSSPFSAFPFLAFIYSAFHSSADVDPFSFVLSSSDRFHPYYVLLCVWGADTNVFLLSWSKLIKTQQIECRRKKGCLMFRINIFFPLFRLIVKEAFLLFSSCCLLQKEAAHKHDHALFSSSPILGSNSCVDLLWSREMLSVTISSVYHPQWCAVSRRVQKWKI